MLDRVRRGKTFVGIYQTASVNQSYATKLLPGKPTPYLALR